MLKYVPAPLAVVIALVTMLSPPLTMLGRENGSDALASLVAFASLYFIFEERELASGFVLLLASIYFRTDFVVLAGPVVLVCLVEEIRQTMARGRPSKHCAHICVTD